MANSSTSDDSVGNHFVNDGSFMEMFKRLQEQQNQSSNETVQAEGSPSTSDSARASNQKQRETEPVQKVSETSSDKGKQKDEGVTTDYVPLAKASQVEESVYTYSIYIYIPTNMNVECM